MTVLMSGINMYAMALVMKVVLGWNIHFSIWVSSLTVAVYVALGGLFSAIFNEVLQFFLIWLGALVIPILGMIEVGGWAGLVAKILRADAQRTTTCICGARWVPSPAIPWACTGRASSLAWAARSPAATGRRTSWWCSGPWRPRTCAPRKWRPSSPRISRWWCR